MYAEAARSVDEIAHQRLWLTELDMRDTGEQLSEERTQLGLGHSVAQAEVRAAAAETDMGVLGRLRSNFLGSTNTELSRFPEQ